MIDDIATAEDILATPPHEAGRLLSGDETSIRKAFRALVQAWHPDHCADPRAAAVVAHLVKLRDSALGRRATLASRRFTSPGGGAFEMSFVKARPFEAGEILVGRGSVAYVVSPDNVDLSGRPLAIVRPRFANDRMRAEMERFLPRLIRRESTVEGDVQVYARTPDQILLADLLEATGPLEPVHAAWLLSGLLNLACWLSWAGFVHGAISPEHVLVSPKFHSVALVGPALYATRVDGRPEALPERTLSLVPRMGLAGQPVTPALDLDLVRATCREALGDAAGTRLGLRADMPAAFATWLAMPPAGTAQEDYGSWERAREVSFGPRRFVEMKVRPEAVYG